MALSWGWKNDAWIPESSHDTNQMNGAFTPEPENLEPDTSCETGFCREQRKTTLCKSAQKLKGSGSESFLLWAWQELLPFKMPPVPRSHLEFRIWHHCSTFCPTSRTSLKQVTLICERNQQKISGDHSCTATTWFLRRDCGAEDSLKSVSVFYPHLLRKWDHYCSAAFALISAI